MLTFVHVTFFEILVCTISSLLMLLYWDFWGKADKVSIVCALAFSAILGAYLLFGLYFVCFKSYPLALTQSAEAEERNLERCKFLHESLAYQSAYKNGQAGIPSERI